MNEDRSSLDRQREYDRLKAECENAMAEVQSLKRQQEETVKRYNHALKETDNYQQKYKSVLLQLQHSREETDNWKSQCEDLRSFSHFADFQFGLS
jgi:FtsZ-binding cell division protein ZapB